MKQINKILNVVVVLIVLVVGYSVYVSKQSKDANPALDFKNKTYEMWIGYNNEDQKNQREKNVPETEEYFKNQGLAVKIMVVDANQQYSPETLSKRDFAVADIFRIVDMVNGKLPITPILWSDSCTIGTGIYVNNDSNLSVSDLQDKKILIYGHGSALRFSLSELRKLKLDKASISASFNPEESLELLLSGQVDAIISNIILLSNGRAPSIFTSPMESMDIKEIGLEKTEFPCSGIYRNADIAANVVEKFTSIQSSMRNGYLTTFKPGSGLELLKPLVNSIDDTWLMQKQKELQK